jgi:lipoprotein-anchoring transpeptidase ErfK/SrfK
MTRQPSKQSKRKSSGSRSRKQRGSGSKRSPLLRRFIIISIVLLILAGLVFSRLSPDRSGEAWKDAAYWLRKQWSGLTDRAPEWPPRLEGRSVESILEAQIALSRIGFSPGSISGATNAHTEAALRAFQHTRSIPVTGALDEETIELLRITEPVFIDYAVTSDDLAALRPVANTWRARAELDFLGHNSLLERFAEQSRSTPAYLSQLNPGVVFNTLRPGDRIRVPYFEPVQLPMPIRYLRIRLSAGLLDAFSDDGRLLLQFPVSIARDRDKRPLGSLQIDQRVSYPNYTFQPSIFPEAAAREGLSERLIIQPGPNNPVGTVWIGLDLPGYGIHGTPEPEQIGRTGSSGCFRLTNWDAETLLANVRTGLPVYVEE